MNLWDFFQEQLLWQVVGIVVPLVMTAAVGWAAVLYTRVTGKTLDEKNRLALQSALDNGIRWAIQQLLAGKLSPEGTVPAAKKDAVVAKATEYVRSSVPGAVDHFKIGTATMDKLVTAKLPIGGPREPGDVLIGKVGEVKP